LDALAEKGANGASNGLGFYNYTSEEAAEWQQAFKDFKYDIYKLSVKYPADLVAKRLKNATKAPGEDA
jgi:3-hydroxybutyryl-CoA dehydrogenase